METINLHVALYVLYRFGAIALEVLQRHADNVVIASFEGTLVPAVHAFMTSTSVLSRQKASMKLLLEASAEQSASLHRATSSWLGPVSRDLQGFDGRGFGINPKVDEDVLSDARRLLDIMRSEGKSLLFAQALLADLGPRVDAAAAAHNAAQALRVEHQEQQAETRRLGVKLNRELVALRRTLRAQLGANHIDYQRLRMRPRPEVDEPVVPPATDAPVAAVEPVPASAPQNGRSVAGG
jgi:hypothetical protein